MSTRFRVVLGILVLVSFMAACQLPRSPQTSPTGTSPASPAASLTPFQPLTGAAATTLPPAAPTRTGTPTLGATLQATPALTQVPAPAQALAQPAGQVNVLFLGTDQHASPGYYTYIVLLVTLRPDGSLSLTSIPANLYVLLPGQRMDRLGEAMGLGGFALVQAAFAYNFGFAPDEYLLTDFGGYQAIIDALGGIDVQVAQDFQAPRPGFEPGYRVPAGMVPMDGATALWYVRSLPDGDATAQQRRSQEVLVAMGRKLLSLQALSHGQQIYDLLRSQVDTSLGLEQALQFLPGLLNVTPQRVNRFLIGPDQTVPWVVPDSQTGVLLPQPDAVRLVFQQAIGTP